MDRDQSLIMNSSARDPVIFDLPIKLSVTLSNKFFILH